MTVASIKTMRARKQDGEGELANPKSKISAVPLQVEQAQLDTWIDIGRLLVEVGKTL